MLIRVSPSVNIFEPLTYNYTGREEDVNPGRRVVIPLGTRVITGWVVDSPSSYSGKVKNIIGLVKDDYVPDRNFLDFARSVSEIYFTSMGLLLDASLSPARKPLNSLFFIPVGAEENNKPEKLAAFLKKEQTFPREKPIEFFYKNIPPQKLMSGSHVTSDKAAIQIEPEPRENTSYEEISLLGLDRLGHYRDIIAHNLNRGKSVLITVPDNLTARYLRQNVEGVDIYNSDVRAKEREHLWQDYVNGKAGVVVGGQSAVLLPIKNLGAVICERAGSSTYKRSYFSKYHINLLAGIRAKVFNIPLIMGFSTHSAASYRNRSSIRIEDKRQAEPPAVAVHMLTAKDTGIPVKIIELIKGYFLENKKILIILNKKESAAFLFCPKCKKILKCPTCFGMLKIKHEKEGEQEGFDTVSCVRCSFEKKGFGLCAKCGEKLTEIEEISIASLKKSIKREVVETGILTLSAEGLKGEVGIINQLRASKIVIATPVIINPFFKDIFDTVIYIKPESLFNINEYSAAEMIFSLISEIRELGKKGCGIDVFSTFHFHYSLKLINDEAAFFERELKYRQWFLLPPFANVYNIEVKAGDLRKLGKEMRSICKKFKSELGIKKAYLSSRKRIKGTYKGIIEAHTLPRSIRESNLLQKRNLTIDLIMI